MVKTFATVCIFLMVIGCYPHADESAEQSRARAPLNSHYVPTSLDSLLLRTWSSEQQLRDSFFLKWESAYHPITAAGLDSLDDTVRVLYDLFRDYYAANAEGRSAKYIVLQGSISYRVLDSLSLHQMGGLSGEDDYSFRASLDDHSITFRPTANSDRPILYLSKEYECALNYLFNESDGNEHCYDGELNDSVWYVLDQKRSKLESHIPLSRQHSCPGFHYTSFPVVDFIYLAPDLSRAGLWIRYSASTGGVEEYLRSGKGWQRSRVVRSWIE